MSYKFAFADVEFDRHVRKPRGETEETIGGRNGAPLVKREGG